MIRTMVYHRKKIWVVFLICIMLLLGLVGRLWYLMNVRAEYYSKKAEDLHERERDIKAARGKILDIRGNILADNRTVCTVSVIHSQIKDPEKVIRVLSGALSVKEEEIRKKVEKIFSNTKKANKTYLFYCTSSFCAWENHYLILHQKQENYFFSLGVGSLIAFHSFVF